MKNNDARMIMKDGSGFVDLTDYGRLEAMTDEEITAAAMSDPDNPPITAEEMRYFRRLSELPGNTFLEKMEALKALRLQETGAQRGYAPLNTAAAARSAGE
jgi:hypothetical protein